MADLPECRLTLANKPFKFCGLGYLGYYYFREGRSNRKAWGLLFTCLCTRCLHVEVITSLDLDSFLLAFSRFTNLRGAVDTIYSDNGSTFCAASERLPDLLDSTDFHNSLRKININWIKIPPYAPSQGGAWEIMVNCLKTHLVELWITVIVHRRSLSFKRFSLTQCEMSMTVPLLQLVTILMIVSFNSIVFFGPTPFS